MLEEIFENLGNDGDWKETEPEGNLLEFDRHYGPLVIGVDEVGRGALAGPITACAVLLDNQEYEERVARLPEADQKSLGILNDSKKLTPLRREKLIAPIKAVVTDYKLVSVSAAGIDDQGIEPSNQFCLEQAALEIIESQNLRPEDVVVLIDGHGVRKPEGLRPYNPRGVLKGDGKSAAIAMASVLAKTWRDAEMASLGEEHPDYGFEGNKGYGSKNHTDALEKKGLTDIHRRSFCSRWL